jgi:DNA (cytosine-5)-methyltransferase 1
MTMKLLQINNKSDTKKFVNYLEELYKHLILLENDTSSSPVNDFEILIEMGVIDNFSEVNELTNIIDDKCNFSSDEFYNHIRKITHTSDEGICSLPLYCERCRNIIRIQEENAQKPTLVDLFCGAGGMSLGFKQAGYKIIYANDIDESCIDSYKFNHPEVDPNNVVLGDIQNLAEVIPSYISNQDVDVVIGGPPCQGFSNANRQRVIDDPRNRLYREYVKVVQGLKPKFFVMENVTGMKNIADQIIEDFNNIGYDVHFEVLNALDFSVPQNRKRIIFIGNRINVNNKELFKEILNSSKEQPTFTLEDAICDLPKLEPSRKKNSTEIDSDESGKKITGLKRHENNNSYQNMINLQGETPFLYNHKARYNNDRDIEIFGRLDQGDKSNDPKIADIMPYQSRNDIFKDKYFKLVYNKPCKTITAHMKFDCNMYIHPTQPRGLTPREAARVQSFPDNYFFRGPYTKTYMQIGNSVPPLMSRRIAEVIINKNNN